MKVTIKESIEMMADGKKLNVKTPAGFQPIGGFAIKGTKETFTVETSDGNKIDVTEDHRFFRPDQTGEYLNPADKKSIVGNWKPTKELKLGDYILNDKLQKTMIVSSENIGEKPIFDVHVDHPCHSFYGNGLVNHNTGKTLLALHALVETQKKGGIAVLIDAEYAFVPQWYQALGGDPTTLIHYQPDHIDAVYAFIKKITETIRNKNKDIPVTIVYDSVAASPSKIEFDGAEHDMGKRAIAHGKGIRMLMGLCAAQHITMIAINQLRSTFCSKIDTKVKYRKIERN